ncbi:MAG TPA: response regulator [Candidatus Hydrogenedentes bacterium]|nr:response regulator [Candidatus Hydrogenedentota bacterium]
MAAIAQNPMERRHKILVVDDEVVIRELLVDILSDEGFEVQSAPNGRVALEKLRADGDLVAIFTDIMMPEMDGITLIREARKVAPSVVCIVMTGYATLDTARAAVKEGAYDYVLKPFNLSEIKLAVNNALERRRLTTENARLLEITELFHISETIASIRDERRLLDYLLRAALARVGAKRGSIMTVSDDGRTLRVASSIGLPEDWQDATVDMANSISGWVAENVRPLLVTDIHENPDIVRISKRLKDHSFISVPLERKSAPIGDPGVREASRPQVLAVLNVTEKERGGQFTEGDLKTLSIVANHGAAALENVRLLKDIEDAQREIVFTLGEIVETRSRETGNHVKRVAEYSKLLSRKSGLAIEEAEIIRLASPLHDVGKVGIPDAILNKPGKLTPEEFDVIKTHTTIGYDMLKVAKGRVLQSAAIIALHHHERFDGGGYPHGRRGKDIHIYGRITGIADVFDALGVERVYKPAWELDRILGYFREERGKQFDPDLTDVFFANLEEILAIRDAFPEAEEGRHRG